MPTGHFIGIDYGTGTSSMAWFNPSTRKPEILHNAEGRPTTPSLVWFGESETLVGEIVETKIADPDDCKLVYPDLAKRKFTSSTPLYIGRKKIMPHDAVVAVLTKLRRDAEDRHFRAPVTRAVLTVPATFTRAEHDVLKQAAMAAGFEQVELLEEPSAAAIAYLKNGVNVGNVILVYDLGAGTFDLALLRYHPDEDHFEPLLKPRGFKKGGNDFDEAIYQYVEEQAKLQGRELSSDGQRNLLVMQECRKYKEHLSASDPVMMNLTLDSGRLRVKLDRVTFEERIEPVVAETVRQTAAVVKEAQSKGYNVDTIVLVGGSSRVPLITHRLKAELNIEPQRWQSQDIAVALGAAYHAEFLWGDSRLRTAYARKLDEILREGEPNAETLARVQAIRQELGVSPELAAELEHARCGSSVELLVERLRVQNEQRRIEAIEAYRERLRAFQHEDRVEQSSLDALTQYAINLGLGKDEYSELEREVLGVTADEFCSVQLEERRKRAEGLLEAANGFFEQGKMNEGFLKLQSAQDADPEWEAPYLYRTTISLELGDLHSVETAATAGLRFNPNDIALRQNRAYARAHALNYTGAIQDYDILEASQPIGEIDWWHWRALSHWKTKQTEYAERDLRHALDHSEPLTRLAAHVSLSRLMFNWERYREALTLLESAYCQTGMDQRPTEQDDDSSLAPVFEFADNFGNNFGIDKQSGYRHYLQTTIETVCRKLCRGFGRDSVKQFRVSVAGGTKPNYVVDRIKTMSDFPLLMTSVLAEENNQWAEDWLKFGFAQNPTATSFRWKSDAWINKYSFTSRMLIPTGMIQYTCSSPINNLYLTNTSPFRIESVVVHVRYTYVDGRRAGTNTIKHNGLNPGEWAVWNPVFENPGFFGGAIKDVVVTATSTYGDITITLG